MEMTERRLTLEILLSLSVSIRVYDASRACVRARVYVCERAGVGRFVSQFLIGLEALNVRLYQRRAQVHRP